MVRSPSIVKDSAVPSTCLGRKVITGCRPVCRTFLLDGRLDLRAVGVSERLDAAATR
jgi:hypothetical protein